MLKSMASIACSWSSVPASTTSVAPSSAIFVRSTRSEAISASATTKTAMANATGRAPQGSTTRAPTRLPGTPADETSGQPCAAPARARWKRPGGLAPALLAEDEAHLRRRPQPVRVIGPERGAGLVEFQRAQAVAGEEALLARDLLRPLGARRRNHCRHDLDRPLRSRLRHRTGRSKRSGAGRARPVRGPGSAKRRFFVSFPEIARFGAFSSPFAGSEVRNLRGFRACQPGEHAACRPS